MNDTTFEATVINGQIHLPTNVRLPENAKVLVVVPNEVRVPLAHIDSPRLLHPEQAPLFQMDIREISDVGI